MEFVQDLSEAERILRNAEHLTYVSFSLLQEKRILLKIIEQIYASIKKTITIILKYEYLKRRIKLTKNPEKNLEIFIHRCANSYGLTQIEIKNILEIFELMKLHKSSPIEFKRGEDIIITSDDMSLKKINSQKTKEYIINSKSLLLKTKSKIMDKV